MSATLSAVIITFNEAKNIRKCIESVIPVADEIIVLDSYSTDGTPDIVKTFKEVRFQQRTWAGFSASKNFANSLVNCDYILSLDADEALTPELQRSILSCKQKNFSNGICEINRLTNYCGKWIRTCGWYPEYKVRIFPKDSGHWEGSVHEQLILEKPFPTAKLEGDLLHYSFPSVDDHIKKIVTYSNLAVRKDIDKGKKYTLLNHGLFKPWFTFIKKFFLQRGFMDGFYGFVIAITSAYERFLRYVKYRELKRS